jgi:hypothetical protein
LERGSIVLGGGDERIQSGRTIAGTTEGVARAIAQLRIRLAPRGVEEIERVAVVVRDQLSVVVRPAERLDPLHRRYVLAGARFARDLAVGDLAHEHMAERVLGLARDRGAALAPDEALALERMERRRRVLACDPA